MTIIHWPAYLVHSEAGLATRALEQQLDAVDDPAGPDTRHVEGQLLLGLWA